MPEESLGFVKLEWTCPKCGSRNPGPQQTCTGCGAPQPENVKFEQAGHQELIKDQAEIEKAKAGPDIHCAFCGTRNPAGSPTCSQCGADLVQGIRREIGQVVGAFSTGPVKQVACPNCSALNPETALKCAQCGASMTREPQAAPLPMTPPAAVRSKPNLLMIGLGVAVAMICVCAVAWFLMSSLSTEGKNSSVQGVHWATSIALEALQPVTHQDWRDEIPANAEVGSCTQKLHNTQDEPAPNSNKVCGTPYTVDSGSGFGEVKQDCYYEVYQDYCEYTVKEWVRVELLTLEGNDLSPVWPQAQLASDQRAGERSQVYTIYFETPDGQYSYTTSDLDLFQQCQVGSEWILNINGFGQVVSIEPVQ